MIDLHIYKGSELLHIIQSPIVPPVGELLWIDETADYYIVKGYNYHILTDRKRIKVELIVQ